jgi:hypothetical protein
MKPRTFIAPYLAVSAVITMFGCTPYARVQMDLAEQARRGVGLLEMSLAQKRELVEQHHALRRQRLDEAFDADVRQTELSADWVIEARQAYAIGLDALHAQAEASRQANRVESANVQAIDRALARLIWLQSIPVRFWSETTLQENQP